MADELSPDQVRKIAALSGLRLDEAEVPGEAERLSAVLDHMACLQTLDLEGVAPLTHVGEERSPLRADEPGETLDGERAAGLGPAMYESTDADGRTEAWFYRVPKVLGGGS